MLSPFKKVGNRLFDGVSLRLCDGSYPTYILRNGDQPQLRMIDIIIGMSTISGCLYELKILLVSF